MLGVILCVVAVSVPVVAYGAVPWNPYDMSRWMYLWGREYIYRTYSNLNKHIQNVEPELEKIHEWTVDGLDREIVELEIYPFEYDTNLGFDYPTPTTYYSARIGGLDRESDVYLAIKLRGNPHDYADMTVTVIDGGLYNWEVNFYKLATGLYDIYIRAPFGVEPGSYLVEVFVRVHSTSGQYSGAVSYYGTGYYVIHCTNTTWGIPLPS
jgi:hypothetical protein